MLTSVILVKFIPPQGFVAITDLQHMPRVVTRNTGQEVPDDGSNNSCVTMMHYAHAVDRTTGISLLDRKASNCSHFNHNCMDRYTQTTAALLAASFSVVPSMWIASTFK